MQMIYHTAQKSYLLCRMNFVEYSANHFLAPLANLKRRLFFFSRLFIIEKYLAVLYILYAISEVYLLVFFLFIICAILFDTILQICLFILFFFSFVLFYLILFVYFTDLSKFALLYGISQIYLFFCLLS